MAAEPEDESFIYRHPAVAAVAITLIIGGTFLGALYNSATSHHEGGEHATAEHGAASGAPHAASGAPAAKPTGAPAQH